MVGIACEIELEHGLHARVIGHVVQTSRLYTPLCLGSDVCIEICQEVATGDDVAAIPRNAVTVGEKWAATGNDRLLRVHSTEHCSDNRVGRRSLRRLGCGCPFEEASDHCCDHLHVPDLLGGDVHDQILVLTLHPAIPALEEVLHGDGHFAVCAA